MPNLQIAGAVYDYPRKGHDRLFIDEPHATAAVLDGSGGDELSDAALQELRTNGAAADPEDTSWLAQTLVKLDNLPEGRRRTAAAAIARVRRRVGWLSLDFANAGDTSLFLYDQPADDLMCIAHTPTTYGKIDDRRYIETDAFLGNFRSPPDIAQLMGQMALPVATAWSVVGCTDGARDDDGRGIALPTLAGILRTVPHKQVPATILGSFKMYDDAAVFVMSYRPE